MSKGTDNNDEHLEYQCPFLMADDGRAPRTKAELLAHYAHRRPTRFVQYDGFVNRADSLCDSGDGDAVFWGDTWELMNGSSVRVLIHPDTAPADAVRLLHKMASTVERNSAVFLASPAPAAPADDFADDFADDVIPF